MDACKLLPGVCRVGVKPERRRLISKVPSKNDPIFRPLEAFFISAGILKVILVSIKNLVRPGELSLPTDERDEWGAVVPLRRSMCAAAGLASLQAGDWELMWAEIGA